MRREDFTNIHKDTKTQDKYSSITQTLALREDRNRETSRGLSGQINIVHPDSSNFVLDLKRNGLEGGLGNLVWELSTYYVISWVLIYFVVIKRMYSYSKVSNSYITYIIYTFLARLETVYGIFEMI